MPLRMITQKRTMGFKLEAVPYVTETLLVADYDMDAYDISYSPELESYVRKLAYGDFSKSRSISGKQKCTVSFSIDIHAGAAAGTAPQYFDALRACGLKQTAGANVTLVPDATYSNIPATIEVVERQEGTAPKQIVVKIGGAMGNAKISYAQVGQPGKVTFEFTGKLVSITERAYASMLVPSNFDTNLPEALLSATITLYGTTQFLSKFDLDLGNEVSLFNDPTDATGYQGAHITNRNPSITIDPDMVAIGDYDFYSSQKNNSTGTFSFTVGSRINITAQNAQVVDSYKPGDREGHVVNQLKLDLKRGTNGNDEFTITHG